MDKLKRLIKCSMKMLTEADSYADKYVQATYSDDQAMRDLYMTLAQMHLDAYNKVHMTLVSHLNQMKRDDPTTAVGDMYELVHDFENDFSK